MESVMQLLSIYNNEIILNCGLLASKTEILAPIKLNLINNLDNTWDSIPRAILEFIPKISDTEPLIICHQDVIFYDQASFSKISEFINNISINDYYFAGVVGIKKEIGYKEGIGINNIISSGKETQYLKISEPMQVDTIDECVMITNGKTIKKYNLFQDFKLNWHFYAVDACLKLKSYGISNYVFPININHLSGGSRDDKFFNLCLYLLSKYQVKEIYTTNGRLTKNSVLFRRLKYQINKKIHF